MVDEKKLLSRRKGKWSRKCQLCGGNNGLIRAYKLNICRRCFRECAYDIGFKKYS